MPPDLRLPRLGTHQELEAELLALLGSGAAPLWREARLRVPVFAMRAPLRSALQGAAASGQLVRGFEGAERVLAGEARGLAMADEKSHQARGGRVSRVIVLASDGSERFYRNVEALLLQHAPRLLAFRLELDAVQMGELLFGAGETARLALLARREAVVATLLALLPESGEG